MVSLSLEDRWEIPIASQFPLKIIVPWDPQIWKVFQGVSQQEVSQGGSFSKDLI
jgi:hypothetical protein